MGVRDSEGLKATGVGLTSSLVSDELKIYPPNEHTPVELTISEPMSFADAMSHYDLETVFKSGRLATRKAYGLALRVLGHANPNVFALDGDVKNSTFAEWFANDPELSDRFLECKIAEQNMFSVAVGLSAAGKVPYCSTFSKFVTRGFDQIEMAINSGANLKIVGSHSGITPAADGPSQMGLPDVAWFRSWTTVRGHGGNPGCYVLQPADAFAAYALTLAMASSLRGKPLPVDLLALGEVGLTGELRPVTQLEARLEEARAHGFGRAIVALHDRKKAPKIKGMKVIPVETIRAAVDESFAWMQEGKS